MKRPDVRLVNFAEVDQLVAAFGDRRLLEDRYLRHKNDEGVLWAAWLDETPVGIIYLWLTEAEEPELQKHLHGVPLLMNLKVLPGLRSRGIGTQLIKRAEQKLLDLGHQEVALAVRTDNEHAIRLYLRLHFKKWEHPPITCYTNVRRWIGRAKPVPEECDVMVKQLTTTEIELDSNVDLRVLHSDECKQQTDPDILDQKCHEGIFPVPADSGRTARLHERFAPWARRKAQTGQFEVSVERKQERVDATGEGQPNVMPGQTAEQQPIGASQPL